MSPRLWMLMPCATFVAASLSVQAPGPQRVGHEDDRRAVVPSEQLIRPAGQVVTLPGRPVDVAAAADGGRVYVKDNRGVSVIDPSSGKVVQELPIRGGTSMHGLALSEDGTSLLASDAASGLHLARIEASSVAWAKSIVLSKPASGEAYPCGIAFSASDRRALVCLSRKNSLAIVDLGAGAVLKEIAVAPAPFGVCLVPGTDLAVVSCWGRTPGAGKRGSPSSGTEVEVDEREVATGGTLCVVDLGAGVVKSRVPARLQPSGVVATRDGLVYVANANSDTVSVLDPRQGRLLREFAVKPDPRLPYGSAPNALTLSRDEKALYVACGGNNAVAVVRREGGKERLTGFIPTGWYPTGVAVASGKLVIGSAKGLGSRAKKEGQPGWSVYDFLGTVNIVSEPDERTLATYSRQVLQDAQVPRVLAARERRQGSPAKPVPVPKRLGDPSVFEHVVYILKENRTYDQVFGDIPKGDGDPKLCIYGRGITPNHHALAEEFLLLDNYYCNGVNSADGHAWSVEGNATSYLERSFGGWTRSYPFGDDPLSVSTTGFLWDNVLGHGRTFRNYGEFDYATPRPASATFLDIYRDFASGARRISFDQKIGVRRLAAYSCRQSPGWNMKIPDVVRADGFLKELREFERKGDMPDLSLVYLPQDHTSGTQPGMPTPRAHMADNDLALGRIVEALSKSRFWPKTCVFVIEDDPQDGFDHIDGHRSLCLVLSPYSRRGGAVVSEFYNQTSVLHTMQRMLGVRPMNAMDARASLMSRCFQAKPDVRPYTCRPNLVPLDEINPPLKSLTPERRKWAEASLKLRLEKPDSSSDDLLNRILWHAAKGPAARYPAELAGAHGKGLHRKQLKHETRD